MSRVNSGHGVAPTSAQKVSALSTAKDSPQLPDGGLSKQGCVSETEAGENSTQPASVVVGLHVSPKPYGEAKNGHGAEMDLPIPEIRKTPPSSGSEGVTPKKSEEDEDDPMESEEDEEDEDDPMNVENVNAGEYQYLQTEYPYASDHDGYKKWPMGFLKFRIMLMVKIESLLRRKGCHLDDEDWRIDSLMNAMFELNLELRNRTY